MQVWVWKWDIEMHTLHFCVRLLVPGIVEEIEHVVYLAMHEVLPNALPASANSTVRAMVDALTPIIIPKLANIAIIPCAPFTALFAPLSCSLRRKAQHTKHIFCSSSVQVMIGLISIVTMPARIPFFAIITLDLDIPFIMLAPKFGRWWCKILVRSTRFRR
jgi:hypothetical protein